MTAQQPIRASDYDREGVAEVLRDAYAAGCLDGSELEERVGSAYSARTLGELGDLIGDLPGWLRQRPCPPQDRRERPPRRRTAAWLWGVLLIAGFWLIVVALAWAPLATLPLVLVLLLMMVRRR
jgi:hypothetical protein